MILKKPLKTFLFPAASILLSIIFLKAFFIAGQCILQTHIAAEMNALNYLKPKTMDYFWDMSFYNAAIDKKKIRYYTDFYEYLLKVFPYLTDTYGILGCCYHYLGDDNKAIEDLKLAIKYNSLYSWNYFNLAAIDINRANYNEASENLQKLLRINPQLSLQRMVSSEIVYTPLIKGYNVNTLATLADHLKMSYRVSFDLLEIMKLGTNDIDFKEAVKKIKLDVYAF